MNRQQRIEDGVSFLDRQLGTAWVDAIDLDSLNLGNTRRCVLGQSLGWNDGIDNLYAELNYDASENFDGMQGPERKFGFDRYRLNESYEGLTKAWAKRIRALRKERSA